MSLETNIAQITTRAIAQRVFPGAVVLIMRGGDVIHHAAYGTTMYESPDSRPATVDTIYDVASLTKMFTATTALHLFDAGQIELDAPIQRYLPRFRYNGVSVWHLLTHTSGLDIRLSALRELGPDGMLEAIYTTEPRHAPGSVVAYTNVNSLLLGEIIVQLRGISLDQAFGETILRPLELGNTLFRPPAELAQRIAPTEVDTTWRGSLVHGTVHDESTHALGGVAGHAGLFSTAGDLGRFCGAWLDWVRQEHKKTRRQEESKLPVFLSSCLLVSKTARLATTNQTPTLNAACGLGWMMDRTNFMGNAPAGSFGHTGFTGPAMVVVPARETVVVVLSNRVYPQRGPATHHAVTAALVQAAID